jgi:hypothetical protein
MTGWVGVEVVVAGVPRLVTMLVLVLRRVRASGPSLIVSLARAGAGRSSSKKL